MRPNGTKPYPRCLDCGKVPSHKEESACPGCRLLTATRHRTVPRRAAKAANVACRDCYVVEEEPGKIRLTKCLHHNRAVLLGSTTGRCGEPTQSGPCQKFAERGGPCRHHRVKEASAAIAAPQIPVHEEVHNEV